MSKIIAIWVLMLVACNLYGQENVDSLRQQANTADDKGKIESLVNLTRYYKWTIPDSSIYFAMQGLLIAKKIYDEKGEQRLYFHMAEAFSSKGNFSLALETALKSQKLAEKLGDSVSIAWAIVTTGSVYFYSHDYSNSLSYYKKLKNYPTVFAKYELVFSAFIGEAYFHLGELDSALSYIGHSYDLSNQSSNPAWPIPYYYMGKIFFQKNQGEKALEFYRKGISIADVQLSTIEGYNGIAELFSKMGIIDSAIYYARKSLALSSSLSFSNKSIESSAVLKDVYKKIGLTDSAFKYQEIMLAAKDSVYSQEKVKQMQGLVFSDQLKQQELIAEKEAYKNRMKIYSLIVGGLVFLIISLVLLRNNRNKQKSYSMLKLQKEKTERALNDLQATQQQLIHSEKMASLGELTAGIAHEIQNPLNFVNNFSDINTELVDELQQEADKGNWDEVKAITKDIKENEEKINHHGKRADAIVKNMLQHSRANSGKKEPTDINALAEEYLRLSYHGLRAKDKSFNATTKTYFDNSLGKINIIPQDIGRVILNLINNAFYVVDEKKKLNPNGYEPIVSISTKKINDKVDIKVSDNGYGIPQKVLDKIFQPFFTTKPTGQGTGLGLSLSYDIVKAHGGELMVETKELEGTTFTISIPA